MQITIIGAGYVGLVTGACFADFGTTVTCVDVDSGRIERLRRGVIPIYEPGLDHLVAKNVEAGRLSFTTDLGPAVEQSQVVFLAVGTPPREDGSAELRYVEEAARQLARHLTGYTVVVTKSTVPVGTGEWLRRLIAEERPGARFGVVSNPEFLREGAAIDDFMRPDRVVIGSRDEEAVAVMRDLYRPLHLLEVPFVVTSLEAAELIKYAANAFLATKISFINEVANLCERVGCDVEDVARGVGMDHRIGMKFLQPGPGYGGSCFPKDTAALLSVAREYGTDSLVVEAAVEANRRQRERMVEKVEQFAGGVAGKRVGVLGLSFKPETDDVREAPALDIIRGLVAHGARVRAYDPVAVEAARAMLPASVEYATDEYGAAEGADVLVLLTEWNQFRALDLARVRELMSAPKIADLRNVYEPGEARAAGFEYVGVGRGVSTPSPLWDREEENLSAAAT